MFQRLFGNTPEEQLTYLQPRILLTALVIVVGLLAMLFGGSGDWIIVIAAYVWGWNFLKNCLDSQLSELFSPVILQSEWFCLWDI